MKYTTFIFLVSSAFLTAGCVSLPAIEGTGRFLHYIILDDLAMEIEYHNFQQCNTAYEYEMSDPEARQEVTAGNMKLVCSEVSLRDQLPFYFKRMFSLTGKTYISNSLTLELCEMYRSTLIELQESDDTAKHWEYSECSQ